MPIIKVKDTSGKVRYSMEIEHPIVNDGKRPKVDILNNEFKKKFHK